LDAADADLANPVEDLDASPLSINRASTTSAKAGVVATLEHPMAKENDADAKLVAEALEDLNKFGALVEHYEDKLLRYIMRISSFSHAEAEEILQEVFLATWTNLNDYDSSLPFRSWIYRIAHNTTISAFRKHKSRGYDVQIELDESLYELPSKDFNIVEEYDRKERSTLVRKVLESLPLKYREVLVLRYFEDHDYESISDILKKPSGTIATLLNRAKKTFRTNWLKFTNPPLAS
jgi:RNA polymerase sigma-70 factor, ECF subfamily